MQKKIEWTKYISPESQFYKKIKKKNDNFFLHTKDGIIFPDNLPDKIFNIYEGNCNFLISVKDFHDIINVNGVEMAHPITPYKIRIGIAQLFKAEDVLEQIDRVIDPYKGIHETIMKEYLKIAQNKYQNYIVYEDLYKMVHVVDESKENGIDGFTIFKKNQPSGAINGV